MRPNNFIYLSFLSVGLILGSCSNQPAQPKPPTGALEQNAGAARATPTPEGSTLPSAASGVSADLACGSTSIPNVKPGESATLTWKNVAKTDELDFATQGDIGVVDVGSTNASAVFTAPDTFDKQQTLTVTATRSGKSASCRVKLVSDSFVEPTPTPGPSPTVATVSTASSIAAATSAATASSSAPASSGPATTSVAAASSNSGMFGGADTNVDDEIAPDMQQCKALKGAKKAQCKKEVRRARKAARKNK